MKKMTKTLWVFLFMLGCLLGTGHVLAATSTQPTGAGTQEEPYQISTTDELFWFAGLVNGTLTDGTTKNTAACAKLTTDITIPEGYIWTPIGSESAPYTGTFDGADYNIDNLMVNNSSAYFQGFVGYLGTGGSIKNLTLGTNCSVTGSLVVGGICGYNNGIITDCANNGKVDGNNYSVGGVCGYSNGIITDCANSGAVSGSNESEWVGGICGYTKGSITDCANSGAVSGSNYYVGGICGQNYSTITDCTNSGAVSGSYFYVGGICGQNNSTITDCANNGKVDGYDSVGGVCGCNANSCTITDCANSGAVTGRTWVGSVCGDNLGTIIDGYWLEGTANAGIGSNRGNGFAISKTADEFASGEVCWLLNGESDKAPVWFQTLGAEGDAVPVLDQTHGTVYAVKDCPNSEPTSYNNEVSSIGEHDDSDGDNLCDHCGGMMTSNNAPEQVESIYQLDSYNDLIWFAALVNGTLLDGTQNSAANAVLTADITIPEGVEWTPMAASAVFNHSASTVAATTDKSYSGVFDGAGHKISNLNIRVNEKELTGGLFGAVTGTIKNLGIEDASFDNGGAYDGRFGVICGLLVKDGQTTTEALVQNCFVINSSIKTKDKIAGAIVGGNYGGTIANCYEYNNSIEGYKRIGNLVGDNQNDNKTTPMKGTVSNCYSNVKVVGDQSGTVENSGVKSGDEFKSGEVAVLLQGDQTVQTWGQAIGTDDYPVLTADEAKRVYTYNVYNGSDAAELGYANDGVAIGLEGNAVAVVETAGFTTADDNANVIVKDGNGAYTCANLVLTDGADFYTPVTFTAGKATYSRTLPETSTWGTIVLPFAAETIEGGSLYEATEIVADGSDESILAVQPLTDGALEAHTPALFQGETAGTFSASDAEVAATADAVLTKTIGESGYTLTGSLSTINPLAEGDLFIARDKFWSVGTQNTVRMQAFRAYIDAPEAGPAQVNALRILIGDATSIRQALSDGTLPVDVYSLQGVQLRKNVARDAALEGLPAGIYIVGGKKVVKK